MIKNLGLILIFITAVMTGFSLTSRMNDKIKLLTSFKSLIHEFKREITYQAPSLSELFSLNKDKYIFPLAESIVKNLDNGSDLDESIRLSFENSDCIKLLSTDEKKDLINIFSSLGKSDFEGQISLLDNAIEKLDMYIENAVDSRNKKSKVYLTTSIYVGLAVVIILI